MRKIKYNTLLKDLENSAAAAFLPSLSKNALIAGATLFFQEVFILNYSLRMPNLLQLIFFTYKKN
jgi:hypothetical protein